MFEYRPAGGLKGAGDCPETLLLYSFQGLAYPVSLCRSEGAIERGSDCRAVGEAWAYHRWVDTVRKYRTTSLIKSQYSTKPLIP